jgi:hypothetical protein
LRWPIAWLIGGLLLLSIPFRARQELANVDLTRVSAGLSGWETDPAGAPFRWSGPQVTLLVDRRARLVTIALSGALPAGVSQQVEVRVDGRPANRITVGSEWQQLRMPLPEDSSSGTRRIDLLISPTWVPAEVMHGSQDRRVLGVKVGEIRVVMTDQAR